MRRPGHRPAIVLLALALALVCSATLDGQTAVRVATPLLATPGGREVATIRPGTAVRAAAVRSGFTQVTLDGYIDADLIGGSRDSFPTTVRADGGARLRDAGRATATILADLRDGMGFAIVSRQGAWVRVRRTGWVTTSALGPSITAGGAGGRANQPPAPPATPPAPRPDSQPPAGAPPRAPRGALIPAGNAALLRAPGGDTVARIDSAAVLVPLARVGGWTRVRVEGWVRDDQVVVADSALRLSLSVADIRADPDGARGAIVQWDVEFISIQQADALRPDMRLSERYMLVRGPGNESSLLYIVIPTSLMDEAQRLESLARLKVTARVRVGRSEPVGVPILDLLGMTTR